MHVPDKTGRGAILVRVYFLTGSSHAAAADAFRRFRGFPHFPSLLSSNWFSKDGDAMTFRLLFLAFFLPISLIIGWLGLVGGAALFLQLRTLGYATTTGTVTHSEIVTEPETENSQSADIRYTYELARRSYEGRTFRYGSMPNGEVQDAVRARPVGAATQVFYDPRNPADAVLDVGLNGLDLLLLLLFVFACEVLACFWWVAWGLYAAPLLEMFAFKLPTHSQCGVKTTIDSGRIRTRLPYYHPFVRGIATLGLVAFVSAIVAAIASGDGNTDLALVLAAWTLTIGSAMGVTVWLWRREQSGRADLVIDPAAQIVELPAIYDRKKREDISIADIAGLVIQSREHRASRGGRYVIHAVVLRCHNGRAEPVVMWHRVECAEAFAGWLRDKLELNSPTERILIPAA